MTIIYKITFTNRLQNKIKPYYYIGSKTNCSIKEDIILDSNNKEYWGSSTWEDYLTIVANDKCIMEVLYSSDTANSKQILTIERDIQIQLDVVASSEYFNKSLATTNNYCDNEYATYKHTETGKTVRLKRDHPLVLSKEYVGVTKGRIIPEDERGKRARSGEENGFYGRTHTDDTKKAISLAHTGKQLTEDIIANWVEKVAKKPKTPEHRAKISRPGFLVLKNAITEEVVRIKVEDKSLYDPNDWYNPYALSIAELDETGRPIKKVKIDRKNIICEIDLILYDSVSDACKKLELGKTMVNNRLNSNKWPTWKKITNIKNENKNNKKSR